jgi:hypothetical protein
MEEEKKAPNPLEGWVIAFAHGKDLVGKLEGHTLKPVYQLYSQMQQGKDKNTVNIVFKVMPVCLLFSIKSVDIPDGCGTQPLSSLDRMESTTIHNAIIECEDMVQKTRAARVGIAMPGPVGVAGLREILGGKGKAQ